MYNSIIKIMKKSILNLGKALNQHQLKQISGGDYDPSALNNVECGNHTHYYDHNHKRWLCVERVE